METPRRRLSPLGDGGPLPFFAAAVRIIKTNPKDNPGDGPNSSSSVAAYDQWWERIEPFWHGFYLGILTLAAMTTAIFDRDSGQRLATLALLATMAAVYVAFGRHLYQRPGGIPAVFYFTLTWASFYTILVVNSGNTTVFFLLFALFPQVWAYLRPPVPIPASITLIAGLTITQVYATGWGWESAARHVPEGIMQTTLVLLVGLLMVGVVNQAERRAELIDELRATRAELAETERARGMLAERERLAREIHDTLAQGFTSVLTLAQAIDIALERDPDQVRYRLELLERTARENLAEARALVHALAPIDLQGQSLVEAIHRVAARFGEETGVATDVEVEGVALPMTLHAEIVLLRTTQESLANIRKHAGASRAQVTVSFVGGSGMVSMSITDDGTGFDPADPSGGFGLRGMRSRAQQAGGGLEVISAPGAGTTIRVHVPADTTT
ncbi:sensor histidine kinase [Phytoactinopolyspora limicola]|uniref:sensor histidine kinase n=1 Tax=Phytoactinopolyspora limicola TaxID=2715536 RepID=UPI00140E61B8|nr:sensor histidine kinase [Phytoactinopolyspora limicola]